MENEIFQKVCDFIVKRINPDFLIVFGSYAKGNTHGESDLDVAFFREDYSFTSFELFQTAQELADIIKIEVDLIDLKEASTVFATQIYSTGKVIYSKNEQLRMELHMRTYSMYTKLNEERQPILDKILTLSMENDVIINKISVIERCLKRISEVYDNDVNNLSDFTKQDSIILNIQRACEASIDLAMHIAATQSYGVPQKSREAFDFLHANSVISEDTAKKMKAMVGFRNIAVHDYQTINIDILKEIVENHLSDFTAYTKQILSFH